MKLIEFFRQIQQLNEAVVCTRDVAVCLGITTSHASKLLARLEQSQQVVHLGRGIWTLQTELNPLVIPQYLVAPFPAYISLQSALYHHGMVSQIPSVIYSVSLARTRYFRTPLAEVSIHHINPEFFLGFNHDGNTGVNMATPEKALLDLLYLGCGKTSLFKALPELEFPAIFSWVKAKKMIGEIKSTRLRTLVSSRLEKLQG